MSLFGRIFPETLFPRKLSVPAEQRLRIAQARAEEALIKTHVDNALRFVETLAPEMGFERALEVYVREMGVPDPLASVVTTRALVILGDAMIPAQPDAAVTPPLPRLRLDDVVEDRRRRA